MTESISEYPLALEGQTFIYVRHMAFPTNPRGKHTPVNAAELKATNVIQTAENTWEFDLTGLPGRYETHYGWSLCPDTPENRTHIHDYLELRQKQLQLAGQCAAAHRRIVSLNVREDISDVFGEV
jgi:hypothetical protein